MGIRKRQLHYYSNTEGGLIIRFFLGIVQYSHIPLKQLHRANSEQKENYR